MFWKNRIRFELIRLEKIFCKKKKLKIKDFINKETKYNRIFFIQNSLTLS